MTRIIGGLALDERECIWIIYESQIDTKIHLKYGEYWTKILKLHRSNEAVVAICHVCISIWRRLDMKMNSSCVRWIEHYFDFIYICPMLINAIYMQMGEAAILIGKNNSWTCITQANATSAKEGEVWKRIEIPLEMTIRRLQIHKQLI